MPRAKSVSSRRRQPQEPRRRPRLLESREEARRLLQARIDAGNEIANRINPGAYIPGSVESLEDEVSRWSSYNKELLHKLFDTIEIADNYDRVYLG